MCSYYLISGLNVYLPPPLDLIDLMPPPRPKALFVQRFCFDTRIMSP